MNAAPKLGIIAGGGVAPHQLVAACERLGRSFFLICLEGQADADLPGTRPHLWVHLGAFETLKKTCVTEKLEQIIMLGRVRRPSVTELRPDWLGMKVLARIGLNSLGDDGLLRSVGKAIEDECGVKVVGVQDIFADLLMPAGALTSAEPDAQAREDIARGMEAAAELGRLDIGQAVLVQQGVVLGVETIEGTDELIARAATQKRPGGGGVLVKRAKPQQDHRYDLPAMGPETIKALAQAGFAGVAIEAGASLLLDRERTIAAANEAGLFIYGFRTGDPHV